MWFALPFILGVIFTFLKEHHCGHILQDCFGIHFLGEGFIFHFIFSQLINSDSICNTKNNGERKDNIGIGHLLDSVYLLSQKSVKLG